MGTAERTRRYRARRRGEDVPKQRPGPKPGYVWTPEQLARRPVLRAEQSSSWRGDEVSVKGGRTRALRAYPHLGPCSRCGASKAERHHRDGNTANNDPTNIDFLCRRCHMKADGRLAAVQAHPGRGSTVA